MPWKNELEFDFDWDEIHVPIIPEKSEQVEKQETAPVANEHKTEIPDVENFDPSYWEDNKEYLVNLIKQDTGRPN